MARAPWTPTVVDREVRAAVTDVLVRYASGIDRRDWDLFRTCFTDDCEADYGEIGVWHGADVITVVDGADPCALRPHPASDRQCGRRA